MAPLSLGHQKPSVILCCGSGRPYCSTRTQLSNFLLHGSKLSKGSLNNSSIVLLLLFSRSSVLRNDWWAISLISSIKPSRVLNKVKRITDFRVLLTLLTSFQGKWWHLSCADHFHVCVHNALTHTVPLASVQGVSVKELFVFIHVYLYILYSVVSVLRSIAHASVGGAILLF